MEFIFYRDVFGGWRWEFRNGHGQLQDSPHSYDTREECIEAAQKARLSAAVPSSDARRTRQAVVLCVQPDPGLRESLQEALAEYHTVLACNNLEAIRLVNASVFDAYVVDYSLPGSSGIHLCRHIRRADPHTPVCFYTAAGSEEQRARAFKAGASAYVCATGGPETLCDELATLLNLAELRSLRAKADEERAIQEELERRVVVAISRAERARSLAAEATERAARAKAYACFTQAGGTPGHFDRWWPGVFSSVAVGHASPDARAAAGDGPGA